MIPLDAYRSVSRAAFNGTPDFERKISPKIWRAIELLKRTRK